jgi:CheY-like chemotaxis protein
MAHGLAAQLGGALKIESSLGVGTSVEFCIPISTIPLRTSEPSRDPIAVNFGRGIALLVDDEDLVRASTADMLAELGYEVEEAASAEAALALVDEGLIPDLLVTDHLMPGMTGVDLIQAVHERRLELPVLIVSGYAEVESIAPELPRLTKPFRRGELAEKLGKLRL